MTQEQVDRDEYVKSRLMRIRPLITEDLLTKLIAMTQQKLPLGTFTDNDIDDIKLVLSILRYVRRFLNGGAFVVKLMQIMVAVIIFAWIVLVVSLTELGKTISSFFHGANGL